MLQGIVKQNQLQLLCVLWLQVEILHALICSLSQEFHIRYCLIGSRAKVHNDAFLVLFVRKQEVCKSKEFFTRKLLIDLFIHSKAFCRKVVDSIEDNVFVLVVDQLITEHSFTLVAPKSDHVELGFEVSHSVSFHNRLLLDLQNSLKGSGQLTHVEEIVEFGRSGKHCLLHIVPQLNGSSCKSLYYFLYLVSKAMIFSVKSELESNYGSVNAFNGKGKDHVKDKELTF